MILMLNERITTIERSLNKRANVTSDNSAVFSTEDSNASVKPRGMKVSRNS